MRKMRCPAGHPLPHKEGKRECTPVKCGGSTEPAKAPKRGVKVLKKKASHPTEDEGIITDPSVIPLERHDGHGAQALVEDEAVFLQEARKARESLVPRFEVKEGEDPLDATLAHTAKLLPAAAQQVEYQLLYGDSRGRFDAAMAVFDQHGVRKKEMIGGGSNTIILNVSGGGMTLPWQQGGSDAFVSAGAAVTPAAKEIDVGTRGVGGLLPATGEREEGGGEEAEPDAGSVVDE